MSESSRGVTGAELLEQRVGGLQVKIPLVIRRVDHHEEHLPTTLNISAPRLSRLLRLGELINMKPRAERLTEATDANSKGSRRLVALLGLTLGASLATQGASTAGSPGSGRTG